MPAAEDMVDTLNALLGGGTGGGGRSTLSRRSQSRLSQSRSTRGGLSTGTGLTERANVQGGGATTASSAGGAGQPVSAFESEVSITSYEQTNSLIIIASPQDYKRLTEIIMRLDVPKRQVQVDAIIMEVGINDNFSLAVESTALTANDYFALNNVVQLSNLLTQGPLAGAGPGTTLGILDGTTTVTIGDAEGNVQVTEIPNVPLLLTALESITDLNVLSRPSLTTVDNTEAAIVDGLNVPFVRGSSSSLDQSAVGRSIFNTVDREDVGMKLTMLPQISEGDYVNLQLEVELSQPVQSSVGADPNIVGPTIQKTNVTNEVVVKDGSIGVIGGFLRESTDRSMRQTPILGDVPMLGWLFRRKDNQRAKRNLVMLVTPQIIKERKDLDRISQYKLDQFDAANTDVIFEKGFIRKIERKQYIRNKHHPSIEQARELEKDVSFGRGQIKR
jgi:general secretion pathway protein D